MIEYAKKSFYRAANAKTGRCASEEVTLHLVKSKCLPILLYGLDACPLTKSNLQSLFMKLFKTSNIDTDIVSTENDSPANNTDWFL